MVQSFRSMAALGTGAFLLPALVFAGTLTPEELEDKRQALQHSGAQALHAEKLADQPARHAGGASDPAVAVTQKDPLEQLMQRHLDGDPLTSSQKAQLADRFRSANPRPKGPDHTVDEVWGPDEFGYSAYDQDEENGMPFAWIDPLAEGHTRIWEGVNQDDTMSDWLTLPFSFPFYDDEVDSLRFSANGVIMMGGEGATPSFSYRLPDDVTDFRLIDPWSLDMYHTAETSQAWYGVQEDPEAFVVTWIDLAGYDDREVFQTFQVLLFPDGDIQFQYGDIDETGALCESSGLDHTGTRGLNVGDASAHYTGQSLLFNLTLPDYAVAVDPATIAQTGNPGDVLNASFTITNMGQLADSYTLDVTQDLVEVTLSYQGTPIGNTGTIQPAGTMTIDVTAIIDEEMGTYDDLAVIGVSSDNAAASAAVDVSTSVINAAGGGPDNWGNTWTSVESFWVDLPEEDRTPVTLGDDNSAGPFPMGGALTFYGESYSEFYVASNGYFGFVPDNMASRFNAVLPDGGTPNAQFYMFWDDLNPASGGTVYYGNDEDGRLVLTFDQVSEYGGAGTLTMQAVVDFTAGQVFFNYDALENGIDVAGCTVGMENAAGDDALHLLTDGDPYVPTAGWSLRFDLIVPDYAFSISPEILGLSGGPGDTVTGDFTIFNAGTTPDSYALSVTEDVLAVQLLLNGEEISNTGSIAAESSLTIDVVVTIPDETGTFTDEALVQVSSDNSDGTDGMPVSTLVINASGGGPDSWGNTWTSSNGGDIEYFWVELDEADRVYVTDLGDDSVSGPFPMGGALSYYGESYSDVYVGSNGYYGFDPASMSSLSNQEFPNANAPNNILALFWDDMDPADGGQVYYGTDDDGRFVLTYDGVIEYPSGPGNIVAQAVIDFAAGHVYHNYAALADGIDISSCTIGIENADGSDGLTVVYNGAPFPPASQWTVLFELGAPPDYYPALEDGVSAVGPVDSQVSAFVDVTNNGLLQDSFTITASGTGDVEVDVLINGTPGNTTPVVQPLESFGIELEFDIPDSPSDITYTFDLTATSVGNSTAQDATTVTLVVVPTQGGPDDYGYFWSTTDAGGQVEYEWYEMQNPVVLTLGDDDYSDPIDMGLTWNHYGNDYTQVFIASNGYMGFNETNMWSLGNQDLPDPNDPSDLIAFFWDDLNPGAGGTVSYEANGEIFVAQYTAVSEFGGDGSITVQVILDPDEEAVRINYQSLDGGIDTSSATIGQEGAGGAQGFWCNFNSLGWVPTNESSVWFGFNVIGPSGPYAVDIDPESQQGVGVNGGYAEYTFEVENRGENASAFSIASEGHVWDVTWHDVDAAWAEITAIPELAYDEVFNLGVRHHVPEEPESFTDLVSFEVTSTMEPMAFAEATVLTAASCTHMDQLTGNLTGTGLFGMVHLSDGEGMDDGQILWNASSVNRFVMQDSEDGSATTISAMTAGHDYQGIAWDSRDNTVWVSYLGGISHKNTDGSTIASFEPAILAEGTGRTPMGLAYDADSEILWAVCSNAGFDEVVRIDISDSANPVDLSAEALPWSGGVPGAAGADYDEGSDQLILVNSSTGSMECFLDLGTGEIEPRGDFCPSGLEDVHGIALYTDGTVFLGATNGLAHPVEHYMAPCAVTDVASGPALPERFELGANYPNPFNPSTMLRVALPQAGQVKLEVYNLLGQRQSLLWNDRLDAGWHEFRFDGSALASGVYFYRVTVADNGGASLYSDVRKMMLMK